MLWGGFAVWVVNAVFRWWLSAPLGHDEARYALDARDLLGGEPTRFLYSAGGMSLVPIPGLLAGGSERALRLLPLLLNVGFITSVWFLARRFCSIGVAGWTVAVLAGAKHFVVNSSELLSDLPSATCLLFALYLALSEFERERLTHRIVGLAPLLAAAFYLRYGSSVSIAVIGGALLVVHHQRILQRPILVGLTAVLFMVLLAPHFVHSVRVTGSITGILRISGDIPGAAEGVTAYLQHPVATYGLLAFPLVALGIVGVRRDRTRMTLWLTAVGQIAALSFTSQSEPRYVFLATALLVILGIDAVFRVGARLPSWAYAALGGAAGIAVCTTWVAALVTAPRYASVRVSGPTQTLVAAAIIARDRGDAACEVVGTDITRLEWYSGCRAVLVSNPEWRFRRYEVRPGILTPIPPGALRIAFLPGVLDILRLQ